jgi:hypothetical protein
MRHRNGFLLALLVMLASCAPRPAPRPAPPAPAPQPQPRPPAPLPPPPPAQWEDAPLSTGDWSYQGEGATSVASFGSAFQLRCEAGRRVSLSLANAGGSVLIVRTSYGARSLLAEARPGALVATLPAGDALLDQIAFSRGRFAVEAPGMTRLILPAWPETARVIEDCRA